MTSTETFAHYRVLSPPQTEGGKLVAVFQGASGDLQTRATSSGAPLSVFVESADVAGVALRVFTQRQEKGNSDSGALAALASLQPQGVLLDVVDVTMGGEVIPAQLCGGEWLLRQGDVTAREVEADLSTLGVAGKTAWVASAGHANLVVEVADAAALESFTPNADAIADLNRETDTTGLVLFTMGGPNRADVSFRAFGPLKGFPEDEASSNMFACLIGVLGVTGRLPTTTNMIRGAQRMPGAPARLTAQFTPAQDGAADVWVGGRAERVLL